MIIVSVLGTMNGIAQNCDVDFPGTALRNFSATCGGSSVANLTLGKDINMGNGDVFIFNAPAAIYIFGNFLVDAQGSGKILIPAGVTVNVYGNLKLDPKSTGCRFSDPCTFEIEVQGTLNLLDDLDNSLVTLIWSGNGAVNVVDNFKNSSNGCMACDADSCPDFDVKPFNCDDDGVGCTDSDFCATILNGCSNDNTDPVITGCPGNQIVNMTGPGCTQSVNWPEPAATDNCTLLPLTVNHPPGSSFPKGNTVVTYTATDVSGNTSTCSFNVNVVDNFPPIISGCPANITVSANSSCQAVVNWNVPTVSDNCNGTTFVVDKPSGSVFAVGTTRVTYTASTLSGESATCSFDVIVIDNSAPQVAAIGTIKATVGPDCRAPVNWSVPGVVDCNEVQIESTHQPGDEFGFGSTNVTYILTDALGNTSDYTFQVVVENQNSPVISNCPADITIESDGYGFAAANWIEPTASIKCGQLSLKSSHTPGQRFPTGTTYVVYTASDDLKNESICSFKVIVSPPKIVVDISKVVTPDGNGINDYLKIENIEKYKENGIVIVDRWGSTIYKANGYDNNKVAWTGTNHSGDLAPTGTYFFTMSIRYGAESVQRCGFIELIR